MEAFQKFLPSLQSLADAKMSSIALECSVYSLDQCEILMQLVLQTIIVIVNNNKDSPEKIEQITALLIATRADEVVDALGRMGMLNKLTGINIKITKGGSYFKELMKGGFSKKTQKGGAGCAAPCNANSDCTDTSCPSCLSGQCAPSGVTLYGQTMSPGIQRVGQPLSPNSAVSEAQEKAVIVSDASRYLSQSGQNVADMQKTLLNSADKRLDDANTRLDAANKYLSELLNKKQEQYSAEFDAILAENKKELANLENVEQLGMGVGAVSSAYSGYKFSSHLISGIELLSGSIGSFLYWLLLTAQKPFERIPFITKAIPLFDTRCYVGNPLGDIWPAVVETKETATSFSYKFTNFWGEVKQATGESTCFDSNYLYTRIGECTQSSTTKMDEICKAVPKLDIQSFFGKDIELSCAALGLVLGGLFIFYMIKILRLQTRVGQFNTGKSGSALSLPVEMVKDLGKLTGYATVIGLIVDIVLPSQQRSELIRMVQNSEVKVENKLLKKAEFIAIQENQFTNTQAYLQVEKASTIAQDNYDKLLDKSDNLNDKISDQIFQIANKQSETIAVIVTAAFAPRQNAILALQNEGGEKLKSKSRKPKKRGTRKNRKNSHKRK